MPLPLQLERARDFKPVKPLGFDELYQSLLAQQKSQYENQIKGAEAQFAPQRYQGEAEGLQNQARLFGHQADAYPQLVGAQIKNYEAEALSHQMRARGYDLDAQEAELFLNLLKGRMGGNQSTMPGNNIPQQSQGPMSPQEYMRPQEANYDERAMMPQEMPYQEMAGGPPQQAMQQPWQQQRSAGLGNFDWDDPLTRSLLEKHKIKLPEEEIDRRKELNKLDSKISEQAQSSLVSGMEIKDQLDSLERLVNDLPQEFQTATGPIGSVFTKYLGSDAAKEALGAINAYSGNITLAAASSLKGAFTGRDISLLQEIKPNAKDNPQAFMGKLKAMQANLATVNKRNELISQYITRGMRSSDAITLARNQTPISKPIVSSEKNKKINEGSPSKTPSLNYKPTHTDSTVIGTLNGEPYEFPREHLYEFLLQGGKLNGR